MSRDEKSRRVGFMTRALTHRGPDVEGFFDDRQVSLGFRRLSVIDLETGQQPIVLADGPIAIVLNGEIYNFRELRAGLESKGHLLRSRGDFEVVLRLYAEEGIGCLARLNGMFALALWDGRERVLHLARDRFGIKPLYWCRERGVIDFASEIRALLAGGFPSCRDLDPAELRHYLALGYSSPGETVLRDVRSVAPASVRNIDADGNATSTPYWRPPEISVKQPVDRDLAPRVPWFEHQPSIRIFEYLQSGLLCLATDSAANSEIVTSSDGVLTDDTPEGFCRGLQSIVTMLPFWRPEAVVASVRDETWESIVHNTLMPIMRMAMGEDVAIGGSN